MSEPNEVKFKICTKCNRKLKVNNFCKDKSKKDHLYSSCKYCQKKKFREYYLKEKTKVLNRSRQYKLNNKEKIKENGRKYYLDNLEYIKTNNKNWQKNNPDKIKEIVKRWHLKNPGYAKQYVLNNREKVRDRKKRYYLNNKDKILNYIKKWIKEKYKMDIKFRLNHCIRAMINKSLKGNKNGHHWEALLGFTLEDLITHLEGQFKPEMTWDNYGKWHIDHRKPIASYNFNSYTDSEFKECWALENLQPLWAGDNLKKSSIWEGIDYKYGT